MSQYYFGDLSRASLSTCHPILQKILQLALNFVDFTVLECHRDEEAQNAHFNADPPRTQLQWPDSAHNSLPSLAADLAPWPTNWRDMEHFYYVMGTIMGVGQLYLWLSGLDEQYILRYGGDWDRDGQVADETFKDLGHIELIRRDEQ